MRAQFRFQDKNEISEWAGLDGDLDREERAVGSLIVLWEMALNVYLLLFFGCKPLSKRCHWLQSFAECKPISLI